MTPPPTKTTSRGNCRSLKTSSEMIMCSAPAIGRARGFEPVAMTMCPAVMVRPSTRTALGPAKAAWPRMTSTPRSAASERGGEMADHLLLAIDQGGPIQPRLAHGNVEPTRPCDLVQRMARGHQHLLRRAAAVRTGAAKEVRLDQRHGEAGSAGRHRHAHAGIAAAQDHH